MTLLRAPLHVTGRVLLLALLTGLAVVLALTWMRHEQPDRQAQEAAAGPRMDAEIWGVHLRQRDGKQQWTLRADYAAHYPEAGETRLHPVHLRVTRPDGPPMTADSRRGRIADGTNQVTLIEDVVVIDPDGYRLTTDSLRYLPAAARGETDDPVRITADFGEADGIGATIWTERRHVQLHRAVTTTLWRRPGDAS